MLGGRLFIRFSEKYGKISLKSIRRSETASGSLPEAVLLYKILTQIVPKIIPLPSFPISQIDSG